jgi:lysophospholipid acyltransferase 1/2
VSLDKQWTDKDSFCIFLRYYFAFIISEAVNNAAGLGFNGFDKQGLPRWNLLTNIKPLELETATSLKVVLDVWNMRK